MVVKSGVEKSGFDPMTLPESNATSYPEPYRAANQQRWNRRLGNHANLTNFGVNLVRIVPGGQSSSRHAHTNRMSSSMFCRATWTSRPMPAWNICRRACALVSRPGPATRIGSSTAPPRTCCCWWSATAPLGDEVSYPDVDMHGRMQPDGRFVFTHKDGTPY